MNYEAVRDAIHALVISVPGVGNVFKHERLSTDWATFLARYVVSTSGVDVINVAWFSRIASTETATRDEALVPVAVEATEVWRVTLAYGFQDDEDSNLASDRAFQLLVDRLKDAFRFSEALGIPDIVLYAEPADVPTIGLYQVSDVVVHRAEMNIRVILRDTIP